MKLEKIKLYGPGFLLALLLGIVVWLVALSANWLDPLVVGIVCGMVLRTIIGERQKFSPGLNWAPTILIPPGIILYGANLRFNLEVVSPLIWLQILVGLIVVVWICQSLGRWFKLSSATSLLLAVGTAICGASAIMIARPAVEGDNRNTASAVLVITIWGLFGLLFLPYLAEIFGMDVAAQARMFATTLQQTGLVKAAASHVGRDCLTMAMTIKVARTVTIIPLLLVVGALYHLPSLKESSAGAPNFKVRIPWYLWGFVGCGLLFAFVSGLAPYVYPVSMLGSLVWTMAMVSIGLTVDMKDIINTISKPLLVGLIAWLGLIAVFIYAYLNTI
ncbi:MAG: putative sulfate exporter family transporter [Pseudomonadota bacterium]